ncbi:UDP-N-acetylmuramate--L-alanine ligase [Methanobrevibacter cuticularis]|uniref:UDP-N-acetylmuramate--L-alanine ligase n=1 Tax=Methanobrevibacter cuticularis TaxID=47311 RepID=A0A166CYS2_9EURY|nr:coenzyme F430 synthase [Methanobrevibacter cuticularis]KZX15008.1 UDP-N-acetylmuramate--L-alanine ligase [Methanobrevibacter cuticularis]
MDVLIIDLTHGGVKIAIELKKIGNFKHIFVYDIYNTLKNPDRNLLESYDIELVEDMELLNNCNNLLVINPIHSPFNITEELKNTDSTKKGNIKEISHHKAINLALDKWKVRVRNQNIPIVEVTGVKGKTSVVSMLKDILIKEDPLVLSSLGACLYKNEKKILLKKNISITPASTLETIKIAKKIANSDCSAINDFNDSYDWDNYILNYNSCLFESSLGVTGIGNIGILTNIVENYPIARNKSNAREAKKQVFNCDFVVAEAETIAKYYPKEYIEMNDKINIFSLSKETMINDNEDKYNYRKNDYNIDNYDIKNISNLVIDNIEYGLDKTNFDISYKNLKTIYGDVLNGSMKIETFAPGKHHVLNVLATITASLSLKIDKNIIKNSLLNFKGIIGRSSQKFLDGSRIIEEINPGINIKAIESSIEMIRDLNDYSIIIGGKYGITCEEIDDKKAAILLDDFIDKKDMNLILTDEVGKEIMKSMKNVVEYIQDPFEAQKIAIANNKDILFIYRSNYSQLNKR